VDNVYGRRNNVYGRRSSASPGKPKPEQMKNEDDVKQPKQTQSNLSQRISSSISKLVTTSDLLFESSQIRLQQHRATPQSPLVGHFHSVSCHGTTSLYSKRISGRSFWPVHISIYSASFHLLISWIMFKNTSIQLVRKMAFDIMRARRLRIQYGP